MTDYETALRRWVNTWHPLADDDEVTIEVDSGSGCPTCGYGDGIAVVVNGKEVHLFDFFELGKIIQGILTASETS